MGNPWVTVLVSTRCYRRGDARLFLLFFFLSVPIASHLLGILVAGGYAMLRCYR